MLEYLSQKYTIVTIYVILSMLSIVFIPKAVEKDGFHLESEFTVAYIQCEHHGYSFICNIVWMKWQRFKDVTSPWLQSFGECDFKQLPCPYFDL